MRDSKNKEIRGYVCACVCSWILQWKYKHALQSTYKEKQNGVIRKYQKIFWN